MSLRDYVLSQDTKEKRENYDGLLAAEYLLSEAESSLQNGELPMAHELVYCFRVAGEMSKLNPDVLSRVVGLTKKYNEATEGKSTHIETIVFYDGDKRIFKLEPKQQIEYMR
tara:strand:+ start:993 stop:1328 length:336 start_codon:yes stop_codon:yes gene_type:complete